MKTFLKPNLPKVLVGFENKNNNNKLNEQREYNCRHNKCEQMSFNSNTSQIKFKIKLYFLQHQLLLFRIFVYSIFVIFIIQLKKLTEEMRDKTVHGSVEQNDKNVYERIRNLKEETKQKMYE